MKKRIVSLVLCALLLAAVPALAEWTDGQIILVDEQENFGEDSAMFAGAEEKLVYPAVWTEGLHGEGLEFADVKTHVRFDGDLITRAEALTLSTWINWRGPGLMDATAYNETAGGVLVFGLSGANGHLKVVALDDEQGDVMTFAGGLYGEDVYAKAEAPLPTDEWVMVTATIDGENMNLYLNGELAASVAQTVKPSDLQLNLFRIGSSFWGPPSLNAVVDDASAWERALSAEEIVQLYEATKPE